MYTHHVVYMNACCIHLYFYVVICFNGSHMHACAHIVIDNVPIMDKKDIHLYILYQLKILCHFILYQKNKLYIVS